MIDAEADGLDPSKIYCLSVYNLETNKQHTTTSYDEMRRFFAKAKVIIGHNIVPFDVRVFEKLLDIKINCKQVDTLALSWYLYPKRNKHGLESWGEDLGIKKPEIDNWHTLTLEQYCHRCEEDVKINVKLWRQMFSYLFELYGSQSAIWEFLKYMQLKMFCTRLQIDSRWKLDVEHTNKALVDLKSMKEEKLTQLIAAMPRVPQFTVKSKPKRFINKGGDYSKLGQEWIKLLSENGLPPNHEEDVILTTGDEPGNPNSPEQVKAWLFSLGWKPQTFKYVKDKETGDLRPVPQVNQEHGKGICPSIVDMYEECPDLELIDGLGVISHRISVLEGFLKGVSSDGFVTARVSGLTNTLRFKHKEIVNLPKVEKKFGELGRGALIAREGKILCGSDMASLEDRIKQHFIYPLDPEYVKSMNEKGFDPHLVVAVLAGMMEQAAANNYRWVASLTDEEKAVADKVKLNWAKKTKPIRDIAKNGNYACQYGAGAARLVLTCDISLGQARTLHAAYWKLNWAIKKVADDQVYKTVNDQMWLFNPISKFWYSLRNVKDIFSTLVQGTASYVFDLWVRNIIEERPQLTGQFHDEIILEINEGAEEKCTALVRRAIDKLNKEINLNRELDISIQYNKRYSGIH